MTFKTVTFFGCISDSARAVVANTVTSGDGSYTFSNLEPGTYTVYAASSYSAERAVCTNVVVRASETTVANPLKLTATGSITGTITMDGNATGNTGFLVFPVAGTSFMAMTDDTGKYTISGVPAGEGYQIVATKNGVVHNLSSNVTVVANGSATMAKNNFTTTELTAGLKGDQGEKGEDGCDGKDGTDGISIEWLGAFASASEIENPRYLNAYFNTTDGCSYIYDGTAWTLLAKAGSDGKDGTSGTGGTTIISSGLTSSIGSYAIATLLSTEELTNEDVTITVNVTEENLSKVGFVYSESQINWSDSKSILTNASFTAITADSEGKYKITATKNGYYTVAAKNGGGYVVATEDKISNIDKTAPAAVSGLTAKYRANTKKLTVTWTNPADTDLDYISLSYTKGGTAVVTDCHAASPYVLSDVEVDGDEYVFSVKAVDKAGNESVVQTASVTPGIVGVQGITLSRYHFAYNDADQTVTAVAALSSADQIEEGTVVTIQTKDPSGNVTNTVATLDKEAGTATATITAPATSSSNSGTTYTVLCKIGDEVADATHTARFNVSAGAYLTGLSQSLTGSGFVTGRVQISLGSVTSSTTECVRIEGYNLDLTAPYIQLYGSTGTAYYTNPIAVDTSAVAWTATTGSNSQTIDTKIPVPTTDDSYTVRVLFGDTEQTSGTLTLQVYDVPKFTSLTIPLVSVTKEDNTVTATIIGKYFDTPDTDLSKFTATCASKPSVVASTSFTRDGDSKLTATFTIPGTVGEYDITVRYGTNSITGTLKVQDFSAYSVGDVLLNDGTIVRYDADNLAFTDGQKQKAVSVLAYFNDYGAPVGLGIYNSYGGTNSGYYKWAPIGTTGYNTMFTGIICTPSETDSGAADTATFTGDTDGSDNWAYICSVDPAGTADAATNYPAFNYVNNYATTFGLTGDCADGWYMPSIAELCYIYRSKAVLNAVLSALGGIQLYTEYWPSSQSDSDKYAWNVNFYSGYVGTSLKRVDKYVCCVRAFN